MTLRAAAVAQLVMRILSHRAVAVAQVVVRILSHRAAAVAQLVVRILFDLPILHTTVGLG